MNRIGTFLLATWVIGDWAATFIMWAAASLARLARWSWSTPFSTLVTAFAVTAVWIKLSSSTSPFFAHSTFCTLLLAVAYLWRFLLLVVAHEHQEKPRPRYQPPQLPNWFEEPVTD